MKYLLFGAGEYGKQAISLLGKENITVFIDNNPMKWGSSLEGIPVKSPDLMESDNSANSLNHERVVVSVSPEKEGDIIAQLENKGIRNYIRYEELIVQIMKAKILARMDYLSVYHKAISWIKNHSVPGEGIINSTGFPKSYPEVTGYFIPSLIKWGHRSLACAYAEWLCSIQKPDGSWYNTEDTAPYIFDTAQILKGLLAIRSEMPQMDSHILRGCEWILSRMQEDGRLVTPATDAWGADRNVCDEVIHIYCLSPLLEAAEVFHKPEYREKAGRIWNYYKRNFYDKIMNFSLLSHFYAYLMEALLDIGEEDMAREAMHRMEQYQKQSGAVPAYRDCDWVCSTGLFQLSLVWFRLGDIERGNRAFAYACRLQNESGGWFGSYSSEENGTERNTYFPTGEISWAVKYFMDALYDKNRAEFEASFDSFHSSVRKDDGRYQLILQELQDMRGGAGLRVLDAGCGKGRYLKNLMEDMPGNRYAGIDISEKTMEFFDKATAEKKQGTLTNIPYESGCFDMVYACESLEHAVDIENALREMARVAKSGGKLIVIDKNAEALGRLEIGEWEQWFDVNGLKEMMLRYCTEVTVQPQIPYEGKQADGLFCAWIGRVR